MANKYLSQINGRLTEKEAKVTSSGAADAGKIIALDASGKIDSTMLRNVESISLTAGEALSSGDLVYIDSNGEVKKAVADSSGTEADGYVLSSVSAAEAVIVIFEGKLVTTGLVAGSKYFLSDTTAGDIVSNSSLPTASGHVIQYIGKAISETELIFEPSEGIVLA